jgi:hypothetical protein
MQFEPFKIDPDKLLLDPNNYRFHDLPNYRHVANRSRYAEDGVQERALALLQDTDSFELDALKDSIETNGFGFWCKFYEVYVFLAGEYALQILKQPGPRPKSPERWLLFRLVV